MMAETPDMQSILASIPHLYRGPGGSAAVVKDGEVIASRSWGYANLDQRAPMTADTILPICSISKQMVCLATVSLCRNPTPAMLLKDQDPFQQLEAELRKMLPHLEGLHVEDLYNMQSGIRDYWAMTMLFGARPEDPFSISLDAPQVLERTKSFHFKPGTEYSYSNVNFYVLGRLLEKVSGQSLAQLLSERVFIPAGMSSASLYINTNGIPLPVAGYEGNEKVGYFAATNRIEWAGDAGIGASLNDMIAYEKYLDRSWEDSSSLYYRTSQQQAYKDGTLASYGFGLRRDQVAEKTRICHGGALRGFRLHRMHVPSERVSVVVMLNHEADAGGAAEHIFKQMVGYQDAEPDKLLKPAEEFTGDYLDEDTQLCVNIKTLADKPGEINIRYHLTAQSVNLASKTHVETDDISATIEGDVLHMDNIDDHRVLRAKRIAHPTGSQLYNAQSSVYVGDYRCDEVDSTFHVSGEKGTLYGSFDGFLGKGPIWLMRYLGEDVWILSNPRGMDSTPPGDWTVVFHRGKDGQADRVTVSCFIARKVVFTRVST